MAVLFEPAKIGSLTMGNRFVRSATWEGLADDQGRVTPQLIEVANHLAEGGVGLIVTGHAYASAEGQALRWQLAICSDEFVPGLSEMARSIHERGGKIAAQLAHAGSHARHSLTGLRAIGPSPYVTEPEIPAREMTLEDIDEVSRAFVAASLRAQVAGFDAVQIHAAHSYLFSQFLSPYFNKRQDEYGGSIGNRARLLVDVIRQMRDVLGPDYPVLVKMNAEDFLEGGLTREDMVQAALMLEGIGASAIEMSGGTFLSGRNIPSRKGKPPAGEPEAYYEEAARQYKRSVSIPLMLVGGIRTLETAEKLVGEGVADFISLSRPLIREPGLVNRWRKGDRKPAACVSDNGCFTPGFKGRGICCVVEERTRGRE